MRGSPTVYDVARRAGVSTATVSRALSGNDRVLPHTRDRVLMAVAELGYVPSGAAKDLAARHTSVLGMCFPDLVSDDDIADGDTGFWYDEVIHGMERAARRSGYALLIAASHASDDMSTVLSVAGRCDGLAVLAWTVPSSVLEHIAMCIPVVLLAAGRKQGLVSGMLDHLGVANEQGAYEVTAHLADHHGHTRIGFVAGPAESPDSASRYEGFSAALRHRGLPAPRLPVPRGDFTTAGGRRVGTQLLARGRLPQALVCANDQTAVGVMAALRGAGLRVPEDIALTGFDGICLGEHLRPSLTTVVQPMRKLGETAVRLLTERITDPGQASRVIEFPVRLVPRASCGCPDPGPESVAGRAIPGGTPSSHPRHPVRRPAP